MPFLRTVLSPEVEESAPANNGEQRRDKSAHISITKVSFSTNTFSQYMVAITIIADGIVRTVVGHS